MHSGHQGIVTAGIGMSARVSVQSVTMSPETTSESLDTSLATVRLRTPPGELYQLMDCIRSNLSRRHLANYFAMQVKSMSARIKATSPWFILSLPRCHYT